MTSVTTSKSRRLNRRQNPVAVPGTERSLPGRTPSVILSIATWQTANANPTTVIGADAVLEMTEKRLGCVGVVEDDRLVGIITDGDLRRHMAPDIFERTAREIMTRKPRTIEPRALAVEAVAAMNGEPRPVTVLFVVEGERPIGALHLHDCLKAGIA